VKFDKILNDVETYYSEKVRNHGPTFKGADWSSKESQELRFEQLLKLCDLREPFSINDYGCGYGALFGYMKDKINDFQYRGYDISEEMIISAKDLFKGYNISHFFTDKSQLNAADYTVSSGIFNVRPNIVANNEWEKFIVTIINEINHHSKRGFSFNLLTIYSDQELMKDYLYYADPCFYFDYCKRHISKNVALLHDYQLYEFTIIVRK